MPVSAPAHPPSPSEREWEWEWERNEETKKRFRRREGEGGGLVESVDKITVVQWVVEEKVSSCEADGAGPKQAILQSMKMYMYTKYSLFTFHKTKAMSIMSTECIGKAHSPATRYAPVVHEIDQSYLQLSQLSSLSSYNGNWSTQASASARFC